MRTRTSSTSSSSSSSHSSASSLGSSTSSSHSSSSSCAEEAEPETRAMAEGKCAGGADGDFDEAVGGIKATVRMFSGCTDAQTGADVHDVRKFGLPDANGAGGACTNALLANVKDEKADTWMSLIRGMRKTLKHNKFAQIPQLSTSREMDIKQPFSVSGGGGGNHKALLIGINYVGMGGAELKGCHNDVTSIKEYISENGFPAEEGPNLKIISDDGEHEEPTKENIMNAFDWLTEGAEPGDSLFLHYSGHGAFVKDRSGDEEDGKDETLIPTDYRTAGQIKDDEIFEELVAPLPAGVTLTVLMDCCHSGTILDLPFCFDGRDGTLDAIDAGGKSVVEKKKKFNAQKAKRAQQAKRAKQQRRQQQRQKQQQQQQQG